MWSQAKKHNLKPELWAERYKERNTGSKAVYIDIEEDRPCDYDTREYSKWSDLPDLLLEQIFSYLGIREKYYASLVCRNWYRAFHFPYVWSSFILEDNTLTRSRFNYYSGWQYVLDHVRCQMCLSSVGKFFKYLTIQPMFNFYNLYEFMNMISWYTEQRERKENVELGVGCNIKYLKFTFPCNMTTREDSERIRLFGTGGKLLQALKRLMGNLKKLQFLELIDLMLDPQEAQYLLDEVCETCCMTLRSLHLINTTRVPYQLLHVGVFLNLQELYISPQNLGDDLIELIGSTRLRHLHILQNRYTPNDVNIRPVSPCIWKRCRKSNTLLSVHLQVQSIKEKTIIWQEWAPVRTVLYDSPHIGLRTDALLNAVEFYGKDLRIYGHKNIPRFHRSKSFSERIDENLMMLVRGCTYLSTLIVTERISTATVLLLAYYGRNLKWLFIRRNAVILRSDWKQEVGWTDEFYSWLKSNSRSYASVEKEVSQMLGYKWNFLTDKEFKRLKVNLHDY
ncbi:uncharacterized protein isoform X2 [Leptinotarsa decemlineata]|uniref:uncharacterized protein isoform X2 n=1 Tax=Leptinotarsa decemlineata TaxID=7539 RepID=UPI000C2526C7|nr:uncharacterized protein LOC111503820 isoform X2 [Leptinotarsa decemlineata]XP_023014005.1 uncharacterized protein LOC111503820 isoform X2 [Leptinotarsa decemlineata]XP_023014006.1 uncharacterized protein LOC111503820 isoform X2 [Leptinotarsa decemlineata]